MRIEADKTPFPRLCVLQVGAISVPINLRYSASEVAYMVRKVQAKMLFVSSSTLALLDRKEGNDGNDGNDHLWDGVAKVRIK